MGVWKVSTAEVLDIHISTHKEKIAKVSWKLIKTETRESLPKNCKNLIFSIKFRDFLSAEITSNQNHMIFLAWKTIFCQ